MSNMVWKNYNGVDVTVDDNGDFCTEVGDTFMRDCSWERLRKRIEEESKVDAKANCVELECIVMLSSGDQNYAVLTVTLTGLNRRDSTFKWDKKIDNRQVCLVVPRTDENMKLLEQLAIAKSTVRDIEQALNPHTLESSRWGSRIEPTKYGEELKNLERRYEYALKGGKS